MENKIQAILEGLNEEQRNAVEATEGPVLIVAGAGSGKTRVLTSRVAYMLAAGVNPKRILALTFTKKAADEMKERIALMVGTRDAAKVVMGTFHAVFVRFLREYAQELDYPFNFSISDTSDSISTIKACIKELQLDEKKYKPKDVLSRISNAKNNLVTADRYALRPELVDTDIQQGKGSIKDIYLKYQAELKKQNKMDFDDILLNMNILFRDCPQALEALRDRFSYIMVDEYQDTNFAQYCIILKLAQLHHNICVVGDDSQSIYAFRGARVQNILNFQRDFPESRIIRLERNYRSTQVIVNAANSLIEHNSSRIPKNCYSCAEAGEKIRLIRCDSEADEAARIASDIYGRVSRAQSQYSDFAVLYRTNAQSRAIEEALRRRNIPYKIYSGNSFFERAEIKDMMAYFKLALNPNDDESFKRVVNKPARGIGDTTMTALGNAAQAHSCTLFRAVYLEDLLDYQIKPAAQEKLRRFADMLNVWATKLDSTQAYELAVEIAEDSAMLSNLRMDSSQEGKDRLGNVEELLDSVSTYVEERKLEAEQNGEEELEVGGGGELGLAYYMENVALLSNVDTQNEDSENTVSLMTVHTAKGLEYSRVFIAGMENNLFPSLSMMASSNDLEEERRLFYVALTRAKRAVSLSYCDSRMRNGKIESNDLSLFVKEIDPQYILDPLPLTPHFGSYGRSSEARRFPQGQQFGRQPASSQYGRSVSSRAAQSSSNPVQSSSRPAQSSPKPMQSSSKPSLPPMDPPKDFVPQDMSLFREGQRIEHNRFGFGRIITLSGVIPELRAVVDFEVYGTKTLLLKYAKMRIAKES